MKKVSLKEYAEKHNPVLSARGHVMTWSYLYRLIRETEQGTATRALWFDYEMEGPKDRIWIILKK